MDSKYLSCKCDVNNEDLDLENPEKNIGNFTYTLDDYKLKYTSYKTMKCYKLVFSFKHFVKNAGSIILTVLVFLYLGFFIYFSIKGISPLKTAISKILFDEKNVDNKLSPFFDINMNGKNKIKKAKSTKAKSVKAKSVKTKSEKAKSVKTKSEKPRSMKTKSVKARSTKGDNPPRRSLKNTLKINFGNKDRLVENKIFASNPRNIKNINMNTNNTLIDNNEKYEQIKNEESPKINNQITNSIKRQDTHKAIQINAGGVKSFYMNFNFGSNMRWKDKTEKKKKRSNNSDEKPKKVRCKEILESNSSMIEEPVKDIIMLDDYELNHLGYLDALELDKRNCCQIYCSLLKRDQNIIFTCFACNDYNLFFTKMAKFIFVLATLMAMNAFLFADKSFHKLFISGVHYYFSYQVLQIALSVIITYVAEVILCFLTLTDRNIYAIKALSKEEDNKDKIFKILKDARHKLIAFFVVAFVILLFYWYFISAFCAVYPATQKIYLIDCTISFVIFSIIPFFVYAISTIFRVISLKDDKKKRLRCLYLAGQAFPMA